MSAASASFKLFDEQLSPVLSGAAESLEDLAMTVAEDIFCLGPLSAVHRFAVSPGKLTEEFNATDGVLGFGYSDQPDSASILRSLSVPSRPSWNLQQPPGFRELRPRRFAVLASPSSGIGELHLRGHDPAAARGAVQYLAMLNQSAAAPPYRLRVLALRYGARSLLHYGDGPRAPLEAAFDTGSSCIMLPDRQSGALEVCAVSVLCWLPLRRLLLLLPLLVRRPIPHDFGACLTISVAVS